MRKICFNKLFSTLAIVMVASASNNAIAEVGAKNQAHIPGSAVPAINEIKACVALKQAYNNASPYAKPVIALKYVKNECKKYIGSLPR